MYKYVGKYRVNMVWDSHKKEFIDNSYIQCTRPSKFIITRYSEDRLSITCTDFIAVQTFLKRLNGLNIDYTISQIADREINVVFNEENLSIIDKEFILKTNGASIQPDSVKNMPKEIRDAKKEKWRKGKTKKQLKEIEERMKNMRKKR